MTIIWTGSQKAIPHGDKSMTTWSCGMDVHTTWYISDAISCDLISDMTYKDKRMQDKEGSMLLLLAAASIQLYAPHEC